MIFFFSGIFNSILLEKQVFHMELSYDYWLINEAKIFWENTRWFSNLSQMPRFVGLGLHNT